MQFKFILAALGLLCQSALSAQVSVSGKVTDEKGESLIGANILVKNSSVGTITDIDGSWSLKIQDPYSTLVFSYTGNST